jgi:hypothetical protein
MRFISVVHDLILSIPVVQQMCSQTAMYRITGNNIKQYGVCVMEDPRIK